MNKEFITSYLVSEPNMSFSAGFHMVGAQRACTDHQPCCSNRGLKREFSVCTTLMQQRYCTCHEGTP